MENLFDQMVHILKVNKKYGQIAVKAEFESEGTRTEELIRLREISHAANLPMVVKIGGCEAIRDLLECKEYRIGNLVAPMIESNYAAKKFVLALERVFENECFKPKTYINVETELSLKNIDSITDTIQGSIDGIVFGRVDYVGSLEMSRSDVNSESLLNDAIDIASICSQKNLEFAIGGGISIDAVHFLKKVKETRLQRFETRKCVFDSNILESSFIDSALRNAVLFELLWLKSKQSHNSRITAEDNIRIKMLEKRHLYNTNSCS